MQTDKELIKSWLHGKRPNTVKVYQRVTEQLLGLLDKPISETTLVDLQTFVDSLHGSNNTRRLSIGAVKSLFTFAHEQGCMSRNIGASLKPPGSSARLSERMLSEDDITRITNATKTARDRTLLRLLYATGGRVGEVCDLKWRDVKKASKGGQVTLFGKSQKTRAVKFSEALWFELSALKGTAKLNDPVFRSQKGGHIHPSQAWRIVRDAARHAGIDGDVSPHWFRHSHASHALAHGASPTLVRDTLGHSSLSITDRYAHANPADSSSFYIAI